jgi:DNA-binding NtrC family response regulator
MAEEVKAGRFREDLFFRIIGLPIELPPLRNRDNDVIILAKHFIDEYAKINKLKPLALTETAITKLRKYTWPGNVRELKAVVDLACVMTDDQEIKVDDLSFYQLGDAKPYSSSEKTLKEFEIEIIESYLKKYYGNVVFVAEKLEIGKSKIYNMLKSGEIKLG